MLPHSREEEEEEEGPPLSVLWCSQGDSHLGEGGKGGEEGRREHGGGRGGEEGRREHGGGKGERVSRS